MVYKLFLLTFLGNLILFAQERDKSIFWAQAGIGISWARFSDSNAGTNYLFSLNYEIQNNNLSFSFTQSNEFKLFKNPGEYIKSYSLKYGRSLHFSKRGLFFPFPLLLLIKKDFEYSLICRTGISYNKGLKRAELIKSDFFDDTYDSGTVHGFGIPLEIEIKEEITSYLGMSVLFFANLNNVSNYWGFNFSIQVGSF